MKTFGTRTARGSARVAGTVALSLVLHGAAFASLVKARRAPVRERIELEVVRREPPEAAPLAPEPPRETPRPRVALARPQRDPPPPPALASATAAPAPPSAPRPLPRVGLSLGSTVSTGAFAVGIGNTVYGHADDRAADPASVRPYTGGVVPAARLSARPRPLDTPPIPYPPEARRAGVEGLVVLVLRLDAVGAVRGVRVVSAPSPELARAAEEGARRFRFSPALADGGPVETEIRFTYTFLLE